jgi:hypothetical protein
MATEPRFSGSWVYLFDVTRDAVLLTGGDKTGDDRFYERMVPLADAIWETYRKEQGR